MRSRVLIVDDELDVLNVMKEMLDRLGFESSAVTSSVKAIELVKDTQFDLIITDLIMPDGNGLELIHKIRSLKQGIPIIITAGVSLEDVNIELNQYGLEDFIKKPFTMNDIRQKVSKFIEPEKVTIPRGGE